MVWTWTIYSSCLWLVEDLLVQKAAAAGVHGSFLKYKSQMGRPGAEDDLHADLLCGTEQNVVIILISNLEALGWPWLSWLLQVLFLSRPWKAFELVLEPAPSYPS